MKITEKTAYLKGLLEGLEIDETKPESKLIKAVIETLDEMAAKVSDISDETEHLEEYLDEVDYDLGNLEADYYEAGDDDEDYSYDDDDYDDDDEDYCYCKDCDDECEDCASEEEDTKEENK